MTLASLEAQGAKSWALSCTDDVIATDPAVYPNVSVLLPAKLSAGLPAPSTPDLNASISC
jgi:hypothetical protein